jgi:hypothetical protein
MTVEFHEIPCSGSWVVPCGQTSYRQYSLLSVMRKRPNHVDAGTVRTWRNFENKERLVKCLTASGSTPSSVVFYQFKPNDTESPAPSWFYPPSSLLSNITYAAPFSVRRCVDVSILSSWICFSASILKIETMFCCISNKNGSSALLVETQRA